jgi:hypothetical protein
MFEYFEFDNQIIKFSLLRELNLDVDIFWLDSDRPW